MFEALKGSSTSVDKSDGDKDEDDTSGTLVSQQTDDHSCGPSMMSESTLDTHNVPVFDTPSPSSSYESPDRTYVQSVVEKGKKRQVSPHDTSHDSYDVFSSSESGRWQ